LANKIKERTGEELNIEWTFPSFRTISDYFID